VDLTKPIPVRIPTDLLPRIDAAAKRLGYPRARLICFCIKTFVEEFEIKGMSMMPPNWEKMLNALDGRSSRYKKGKP
jgi:hypothetical protein